MMPAGKLQSNQAKQKTKKQKPADEVILIPAYEDAESFAIRKNEVQIILTDMFLKLYKRGRPKKEDDQSDGEK